LSGQLLRRNLFSSRVCQIKHLLLFDTVYTHGQDFDRKSFECLRLGYLGIHYPATCFGNRKYLLSQAKTIGFPLIIKPSNGRKSEHVFKVNSLARLKKLIHKYDKQDRLLIQRYIDTDYYVRLTVVGGKKWWEQ